MLHWPLGPDKRGTVIELPRGKFKPQPLTEEEKAARLEAAHSTMAEQVATLRTSEDWQRYLTTAAKFHRYSFRNVLLLYAQAAERGIQLSQVAGFSRWLELNRSVRRGERGLKVYAPIIVKKKEGDNLKGEDRLAGFKLATVFDYSQTEATCATCKRPGPFEYPYGVPGVAVCAKCGTKLEAFTMPERPELPPGDVPAGLLDTLHMYAAEIGYPIDYGQPHGGEGHCDHDGRRIVLAAGMSEAEETHTALHEIGHALLHHPEGERPASEDVRETEAESVAFLVASLLGLDLGSVAFDYVAGWAPDLDTVTAVGGRVMGAAKQILAAVETSAEDTTSAEPPVKVDVVATVTAKPRRESEVMATYYAERDRRNAELEQMAHGYAGDKRHLIETGQWKAYTLKEHLQKYGSSRAQEMASA
jgi:hypothetical protein